MGESPAAREEQQVRTSHSQTKVGPPYNNCVKTANNRVLRDKFSENVA